MGCRGKKKEKDSIETENEIQKRDDDRAKCDSSGKETKEDKAKREKEKKEKEKERKEKEKQEKKEKKERDKLAEKERKCEKQELAEVDPESLVQVPVQEDVVRTRAQKCGSCCMKFVAFLFSTIGLTCVMVGYTILGGIIFMQLEGENEKIQKNDIQLMRRTHIERLWNMTVELNVLFEKNWTIEADTILESYTQKVFFAIKKKGWDGKNNMSEKQWTFAGSILYSLTVVTTIGYGHIAPKTVWGRVVTIVYAIFGIPLTLLTLTNLGSFMATAFRFLYYNICCGLCCICCPKKERPNVRSATVKYKDAKNGDPGASQSLTREEEEVRGRRGKVSVRVYWRNGIQRVLKTDDMKTVSVPIYVSLLLMTSYIMLGAVLFSLWEEDWDYLVGSYFCFITLTTIGFGDYVPGTSYSDVDSWEAQKKLVLCAMYLIFGLALIVMCFDLMQEEARNKCRFIGRKLGILKKRNKTPKVQKVNKPR